MAWSWHAGRRTLAGPARWPALGQGGGSHGGWWWLRPPRRAQGSQGAGAWINTLPSEGPDPRLVGSLAASLPGGPGTRWAHGRLSHRLPHCVCGQLRALAVAPHSGRLSESDGAMQCQREAVGLWVAVMVPALRNAPAGGGWLCVLPALSALCHLARLCPRAVGLGGPWVSTRPLHSPQRRRCCVTAHLHNAPCEFVSCSQQLSFQHVTFQTVEMEPLVRDVLTGAGTSVLRLPLGTVARLRPLELCFTAEF